MAEDAKVTEGDKNVAGEFDSNVYCATTGSAQATPGSQWVLCVFNAEGTSLLAVGGQQSLSISRSADSIDTDSKDTIGNWKSAIAGMKEWSIDVDGVYVPSDAAHTALTKAFNDGDLVCVKIMDQKKKSALYGGLAAITDYSLDANYDDAVSYKISLQGNGALTDLTSLGNADAAKVTARPSSWTAS